MKTFRIVVAHPTAGECALLIEAASKKAAGLIVQSMAGSLAVVSIQPRSTRWRWFATRANEVAFWSSMALLAASILMLWIGVEAILGTVTDKAGDRLTEFAEKTSDLATRYQKSHAILVELEKLTGMSPEQMKVAATAFKAAASEPRLLKLLDRVSIENGNVIAVKFPNDKGRYQLEEGGRICWYPGVQGGHFVEKLVPAVNPPDPERTMRIELIESH